MSDDEQGTDDEVVVPDEVTDPGGPRAVRRGGPRAGEPGERPDRRPMWAMAAGLGSVVLLLLLFAPLLAVPLAVVGIVQGWRLLRELDAADEANARPRKQARYGMAGGIVSLVLFTALVVWFSLFYEPPDKDVTPGEKGEVTTTAEAAG